MRTGEWRGATGERRKGLIGKPTAFTRAGCSRMAFKPRGDRPGSWSGLRSQSHELDAPAKGGPMDETRALQTTLKRFSLELSMQSGTKSSRGAYIPVCRV